MCDGGNFLHVLSTLHVLLVWLSFTETRSQETTGQKAHFSLKDTPGSFTVHANKMSAKVSSQADSINVVVEPGMAKYPLLQSPTEKPLVHVISPAIVRPVGGWNYFNSIGKKRSRITGQKTGREEMENLIITRKLHIAQLNNHFSGPKRRRLRNQNNNEVSSVIARFPKFVLSDFKWKNFSRNLANKSKSKRSEDKRKMVFSGGTGQLNVHVDRNETKVLTSTGELQVFIKNPSMTNKMNRSEQQSERMNILRWDGETPYGYEQ